MPFENYGSTTVQTYNDVSGDQHNYFTSIIHVDSPATTAAAKSSSNKMILPFTLPALKPYSTFISLIAKIQTTLHPIELLAGESDELQRLVDELPQVLTTTALVGRLIEFLHCSNTISNLVWLRRISDRVGRWVGMLEKVVTDIARYRDGLRGTMIGPFWERVWWSAMQCLSERGNIERIVKSAYHDLVTFKQPLERLLYYARQGIFCDLTWRQEIRLLSTYIDSCLTLPQTLVPHGTISIHGRDSKPHLYPFDSYTSYSDLLALMVHYLALYGWVDLADQQLLSSKKLASMVRYRKTPQVSVEPVFECSVISSGGTICPRCGSVSSNQDWRVCVACELRFTTKLNEPTEVEGGSLSLGYQRVYPSDRYIVMDHFHWARLATISRLEGLIVDPASVLRFLCYLSDIKSPMAALTLKIDPDCQNVHIPEEVTTTSKKPLLRHLQLLELTLGDCVFDFSTLLLPQLATLILHAPLASDANVLDWILSYHTLTHLNLFVQWGDIPTSFHQIFSSLLALKELEASNLPDRRAPVLRHIVESARLSRAWCQDDLSICLRFSSDYLYDDGPLPYPWQLRFSSIAYLFMPKL